jgi:hypothetical protein
MLPFRAGGDVVAAVMPGQALQLEPDAQLAGVEVDERPAEPQSFTLPCPQASPTDQRAALASGQHPCS